LHASLTMPSPTKEPAAPKNPSLPPVTAAGAAVSLFALSETAGTAPAVVAAPSASESNASDAPSSTSPSDIGTVVDAAAEKPSDKDDEDDLDLLTGPVSHLGPSTLVTYTTIDPKAKAAGSSKTARRTRAKSTNAASTPTMTVEKTGTGAVVLESETPATTSRKSTGKEKALPIKVNKRVCCKGDKLRATVKNMWKDKVDEKSPAYKVLASFDRKDVNLYGTVTSKLKQNVWNVKFDLLPAEDQVFPMAREYLTLMAKGQEEKKYDREEQTAAAIAEKCAKANRKKLNHVRECTDAFLELSRKDQATAQTFNYRYGPGETDAVSFDILADDDQITVNAMTERAKQEQKEVNPAAAAAADDNDSIGSGFDVEESGTELFGQGWRRGHDESANHGNRHVVRKGGRRHQ